MSPTHLSLLPLLFVGLLCLVCGVLGYWLHGCRRHLRDLTSADVQEARKRELLAASVFSSAQEGIIITRPDAGILMINEAFTRITGYTQAEAQGKNPRLLQSGRHSVEHYQKMWHTLLTEGSWRGEFWNLRKNGDTYLQSATISAVRDEQGQILHFVGLISDITQLYEHEQALRYQAHYDALTDLPNRFLLQQSLAERMQSVDTSGRQLLIAYLDLDNFKQINESHGHDIGNQLLKRVALRIQELLDQSVFIARIGGDELAMVLEGEDAVETGMPIMQQLLQSLCKPYGVQDLQLQISASIGLTVYPQKETIEADQLMRQAEQAMFVAKQTGKNCCHLFDLDEDSLIRDQHAHLQRLNEALQRQEFCLYYQPKVDLHSGTVIGAEALIRWQHPERGLLSPAHFLPEVTGHPLSIAIGRWVLRTALAQTQQWKQQGLDVEVSVNIDGLHLQQPDFVTELATMLADCPEIDGRFLQLEILESSVLADIQQIFDTMKACQDLQVRFALDDFGTGYSSLAYLKRLPASIIKIDQSFVRNMLKDPDDIAILKGIMGLAQAFGREVIAEGVETWAHARLLADMQCYRVQGYGIARPMPADALPDWIEHWRHNPWCWKG